MSNLLVNEDDVTDDIESSIEIIEGNGGTGEPWEAVDEDNEPSVPRWLFPRFKGATEPGDMYLSRSGIGYDTDVETAAAWLDAPRNVVGGVMLLGNPGTGKTALAQAACTHADREYETLTATPDHTKDSLLMHFVGEGLGEEGTAFVKSVMNRCAEEGKTVIVDEFLLFVDGVKPLWYSLTDGNHWLPEGNIDGTALEIHPEARVIITANPLVRGASLPEPIASRFAGTTLHVETSAALLRDMDIDESLVAAWTALGTAGYWRPEIRELRIADYWMGLVTEDGTPVGLDQAVAAFLPEHCPESQRKQIRDMVVSFIGGNVREDGRMVVR